MQTYDGLKSGKVKVMKSEEFSVKLNFHAGNKFIILDFCSRYLYFSIDDMNIHIVVFFKLDCF